MRPAAALTLSMFIPEECLNILGKLEMQWKEEGYSGRKLAWKIRLQCLNFILNYWLYLIEVFWLGNRRNS